MKLTLKFIKHHLQTKTFAYKNRPQILDIQKKQALLGLHLILFKEDHSAVTFP